MPTALQVLQSYAQNNQEYTLRFGPVTQENFETWVNGVLDYPEVKNSFLSYLINKIGRTYVNSMIAKNPLAFLRGEDLPFGSTIEDMFVEITRGTEFDPTGAKNSDRKLPDVKVLYYYRNVNLIYKVSISDKEIKLAFYREGQMSALLQRITASLWESHRHDFFVLVKEMFAQYNGYNYIKVPALDGTQANAQAFGKTISASILSSGFDNRQNNAAGVLNNIPDNEGVLLLTVNAKTSLDWDYLASVFNLTDTELKARTVVVDNFNELENVEAIYIDRRFAQIHYLDESMESFRNAEGRFTNYTLTEEAIFACSKYMTAIAFTTATVIPLTISANGGTGEIVKGYVSGKISAPFNVFEAPTGKTFKGWGATAAASTVVPELGEITPTVTPASGDTPASAAIYAIWQ